MDNGALIGKKLLIGVDNESALTLFEPVMFLRNVFKSTGIIICIGLEETIKQALKENPDVIFLYFDEDPSLKAIADIQREVNEINKLNCKLIVYSKHTSHRHVFEVLYRIMFLDSECSLAELCNVVSCCLQSRNMKILIAMNREGAVNHLRSCINSGYPGNHVIYELSALKSFGTILEECPHLVLVDFKGIIGDDQEETFALLNRIKNSDKLRIKPVVLVWSPYAHLRDAYILQGATDFNLWDHHLDSNDVKSRLKPYLGMLQK